MDRYIRTDKYTFVECERYKERYIIVDKYLRDPGWLWCALDDLFVERAGGWCDFYTEAKQCGVDAVERMLMEKKND